MEFCFLSNNLTGCVNGPFRRMAISHLKQSQQVKVSYIPVKKKWERCLMTLKDLHLSIRFLGRGVNVKAEEIPKWTDGLDLRIEKTKETCFSAMNFPFFSTNIFDLNKVTKSVLQSPTMNAYWIEIRFG